MVYFPLSCSVFSTSGRNSLGRITSYHRGGRCKLRYRIVNYSRLFVNVPAYVLSFEFSSSSFKKIALTIFANGFLCYHLSSRGQQVGDVIVHYMQDDFFFSIGSSYAISKFVTGSYICNLSGSGSGVGKFVRSSFGSAQVMKQLVSGTVVKLPSGKFRFFKLGSFATFGKVAEKVRSFEKRSLLLKAGQVRNLGSRPVVRGVAINPIDHPHGGGEGRTSGGRSSVSPWGILTKGKKTRKRKVEVV